MKSVGYNPFHGCKKISDGCKYCYVYRMDAGFNNPNSATYCHKNKCFDLPIKKKRNGQYKYESGTVFMTCFTSDFLLDEADKYRDDIWKMMKQRSDCYFYFFTKRIDRLEKCLPEDWGDGYDNVIIGCTTENQKMADYRLPIFLSLPIKHRSIIVAPMLEKIDIRKYLNASIEEVSASGESGLEARVCDYKWILDLRQQCVDAKVPFTFHQTGAHFIKNDKLYNVERKYQLAQARKANIDYKGL